MNNTENLKIVTIKTNTVFKNNYIELQNNDVIFPDKKNGKHIKIIENNSNMPGVVVICQNEIKEILLINLYRYGVDDNSIEFPRGYKTEHESLIDAGTRELSEETNIKKKNITNFSILGSFFINSAHTASEVGVVLFEIKSKHLKIKLERKESINNFFWLNINSIKNKIKSGQIKDSFTINSLMLYLLND